MKLLSGIFVAAVSGKTINRENRTFARPTLEETRDVINEIAEQPAVMERNVGEQPKVINTLVGVPEIADDVHGPQNLPPPPSPPIGEDEIHELLLLPMPAIPVFDATYFGVQTCNKNSALLEFCEQANPALFSLRREVESDPSHCTCLDPFTGQVTVWYQECSKPCPSEDGNTCVEQRASDLAMLEHATNNGTYIADFAPTECEKENEAFFRAKNWIWTGECFCHSPLTGINMAAVPCELECPTLQNGVLSFPDQ